MVSKDAIELMQAPEEILEAEKGRREGLQNVGFWSFVVGATIAVAGDMSQSMITRAHGPDYYFPALDLTISEIQILAGFFGFIAGAVTYGVFSHVNSSRLNMINEELNSRRGQLKFWDDQGNVRVSNPWLGSEAKLLIDDLQGNLPGPAH